jgi:preprotein translocase subunit SecA
VEWDWKGLNDRFFKNFGFRMEELKDLPEETTPDQVGEKIFNRAIDFYEEKEKKLGAELIRNIERVLLLQTLDTLWKDHLLNMDHLREGIGLRGYAQKDPIVEYKREGFAMFEAMLQQFHDDAIEKLFRVQVEERQAPALEVRRRPQPMIMGRGSAPGEAKPEAKPAGPVKREVQKVGRNDPCPCGSGKKYKKCHGS